MKYNKGIILAGGLGSRLSPISNFTNKHFFPIHDKPMIFYSLSILMLSKIKDICFVADKNTLKKLKEFFHCGKELGVKFKYIEQNKPHGIGHGLAIAKNFIKKSNFCLILGDGLFYGSDFTSYLNNAQNNKKKCNIFSYEVSNPSSFGVLDSRKKNVKIIEKPKKFISNEIITGLYFLPNEALQIAQKEKKSKRGEIEITNILNKVFKKYSFYIHKLKRGIKWIDMGTIENIQMSNEFIKMIEKDSAKKIACLEEISINNKWITKLNKLKMKKKYGNSDYYQYLKNNKFF